MARHRSSGMVGVSMARYPDRPASTGGAQGPAPTGVGSPTFAFTSFTSMFDLYVERGFVDPVALLSHPDAPPPCQLLLAVMEHRTPCIFLTRHALHAALHPLAYSGAAGALSAAGSNAFALEQVVLALRDRCPTLYGQASIKCLLCQALLHERLFDQAVNVFHSIAQDEDITPAVWRAMLDAAGEGKLPDSALLWRLLSVSAPSDAPTGRVGHVSTAPQYWAGPEPVPAAWNYVPSLEGPRQGNTPVLRPFDVREATMVICKSSGSDLPPDRAVAAPSGDCFLHPLSVGEVGYALSHYAQPLDDDREWFRGVAVEDTATNPQLLRERDNQLAGGAQKTGIVFGLDTSLASKLLLRANTSFAGQASPLVALHIMHRYVITHRLGQWSRRGARRRRESRSAAEGSDGASEEVRPHESIHPAPFLVFFKLMRETRDVVSADAESGGKGLPMVHWELVWRYFQLLNRENPTWYTVIPEEAEDLCQYVIEVLCRGANPWLTLNVARSVSARHIVDGVEMSIWLLHRLDVVHHRDEACEVTVKIFRWLLADVGIHLQPHLQHNIIPAARVLIRLSLQDELKQLYNAVLDNVYVFPQSFREEFVQVMSDLVCPSCSSILPDDDVYATRTCPMCMAVVPPKEVNTLPSFSLTADHIVHLRNRQRAQSKMARQRIERSVARLGGGRGRAWVTPETGAPMEMDGTAAPAQHRLPAPARPLNAAALFERRVLRDSSALLPGVSPGGISLFGRESSTNVHAAMEESTRRLELQDAARRYALAKRGVTLEQLRAALPSSLPLVGRGAGGCILPLVPFNVAGSSSATFAVRVDGQWTCVWCREGNTEWSSRTRCAACGAETGPAAPWREFAYAADGDVMNEVRSRISNCEDRPADAIVAAYLLMVYRRAFLLRAVPHDHEQVDQLIRRLAALHERVLAGYLYMRLVPPQLRCKGETMTQLAQLFGSAERVSATPEAELVRDDERLFMAVFSPSTCKVCFGTHTWQSCPIITRDFTQNKASGINLSLEEKQQVILEGLKRSVDAATRGPAAVGGSESQQQDQRRKADELVVQAYADFVSSPFRELFAEVYSAETNLLSMVLSVYKQFRRAAFVLCHIPLHLRHNQAYMMQLAYFNAPHEDALKLLEKRSANSAEDDSHPNFVQVTLTCCMCLDGQHASFACPRLGQWFESVIANEGIACGDVAKEQGGAGGGSNLFDVYRHGQEAKRLRAQADSWTTAGPERLHAFYRFLLGHIDELQRTSVRIDHTSSPAQYAFNKIIQKLASVGKCSYAYRLYARGPTSFISKATTAAMLRMNRFSEESVRALLGGATQEAALPVDRDGASGGSSSFRASEASRAAALPLRDRCLLCFEDSHTYFKCPELAAQPSHAARLEYVARQVGGIRATSDGVKAAAAFVYHTYNMGNLTGDMMRAHPSLVLALLQLSERCFALRLVSQGVRTLRRIAIEMVPLDDTYVALWRAAGLSDEAIEQRRIQLGAVLEAEGIVPSVVDPPPRRTYSNRFMANLSHALHDELCRHCYLHGHTLATCSVFHAEVSFGRDFVAAYRMSMMSEQLDRDWQDAYLVKLVDFFLAHRYLMPYHIAGVANSLNAIAAMWCFRGEPGIALQQLLAIPPAYRRRQAFKHILHALNVSHNEIVDALAGFHFSSDTLAPTAKGGAPSGSSGVFAQHLLLPKPATRDVALEHVFSKFPAAVAALESSDERMHIIRRRNATQRLTDAPTSTGIAERRHGSSQREQHPSGAIANTGVPTQESHGERLVVQSGDITSLREDFDPILTELEDAVGMKLGSRHILFTGSVDVLAPEPPTDRCSAPPPSSSAPASGNRAESRHKPMQSYSTASASVANAQVVHVVEASGSQQRVDAEDSLKREERRSGSSNSQSPQSTRAAPSRIPSHRQHHAPRRGPLERQRQQQQHHHGDRRQHSEGRGDNARNGPARRGRK